MRLRLITTCLICFALCPAADFAFERQQPKRADNFPWAPEARCKLNPSRPEGLHPDAYLALQRGSAAHRITQGINHSVEPGNVHDTDGTINGNAYTGAVDISVRCLTAPQIQAFLGRLAEFGFAAWYRKDGRDGWSGPPHIHAVWAGCRLKPVLKQQVESWISGRNGLGSNQLYQFWQPSAEMKERVQSLYRKYN
jgi:hypothetical protein